MKSTKPAFSTRANLTLALFCCATCWAGPVLTATAADRGVHFNRDIRPILSDNCLHCHGFDSGTRKADLRLDTFEGATATRGDIPAITPGNLELSALWKHITSSDPNVIMPPPESGKRLKPEQINTLKLWILNGAQYQKHWAFEQPIRPEPPDVRSHLWPRNAVDRFILADLETKQLSPTIEADKPTWLRRVTLDLTGLPPTPEEVDAFLRDADSNAHERVVDRLLASPHYGEHMARYWLDVARYGDTHGLHLDNERSMWPYRDWVVSAFNGNLPFNDFTVWQLAGDLLPNPTREQLVASGFNRCNVSTSEGGAIDEEFHVRYAIDRVETTSTAWMGLTMGCAVCHDHKLDPITQKEFFQVFSIFNNMDEKAMDGNALLPPPILRLPTPEQEMQLAEWSQQAAAREEEIANLVAKLNYVDPATVTNAPRPEPKETVWIEDDFPSGAQPSVNAGNEPHHWIEKDGSPVFSGKRAIRRAGKGLNQVFFPACEEPLAVGTGDTLFAHVYLDPLDPPKAIMVQFHLKDWNHRANWGDPDAIPYGKKDTSEKLLMGELPVSGQWVRLEVAADRLGFSPGTQITGMAFTQVDGACFWDKAGTFSSNDPATSPYSSLQVWAATERKLGDKSATPGEIKELLKKDPSKLAEGEASRLREHYLKTVYLDPEGKFTLLRTAAKSARTKHDELEKKIPATMVSKELAKPRPANVLIRGEYDKHGEPVGPGVPSMLPPLPAGDQTNRLTFARWLVDPVHPLTTRVTVNRFWQQFFGTGLVKTSEDFGSKGEWPSHPELLDWLATEFMSTGWDVKKLVRLLVTSSTYRQDSKVTPALLALDPENRWIARGPRHRLDAEVIRDNALFVSGLVNLAMGGRGVRPYQPPGIWEAVGYTTSDTAKYSQENGDALYRRSLYTFWKRTAPPPAMTTLDAPSREQCRSRRERTNTPLQALLTMNDVQYFEAARHLGYRMLRDGGTNDADRLKLGFRIVTSRWPTPAETEVLAENLAAQRANFASDQDAAGKVISVGNSPAPEDVSAPELAAYTMVANVLLNLDEFLTKN